MVPNRNFTSFLHNCHGTVIDLKELKIQENGKKAEIKYFTF